ncbi:MAG: 4Fe-4S binding protein [Planctomycetota bacterium]|jgi:polyferredoxin
MRNRQNIRTGLILISFLLFPVTIFYFSPVLVIIAAADGIIAGSLVIFLFQFLGSLFFGRLFCGWICAAAGLQEACFAVRNKRAAIRFGWIKYIIWIPWISAIVIIAIKAGGLRSVNVLYQTKSGISVAEPSAYIIYFTVTGIIILLSFTAGRRSFCYFGCWMSPFMIIGTKISDTLSLPRLRLKAAKDKCIACKKCTKACPMSLEVEQMIQTESMDKSECVLCGNCADNCPVDVIRYSFGSK